MFDVRLPDLRIAPIGKLILHEKHDERRTSALIARFQKDALLKSPPIATPLDDSNYVILDGANRVTALDLIGIPHILIQIVPYDAPSVRLSTWRHVVLGPSQKMFCEHLTALEGITAIHVNRVTAQAELARRTILTYCLYPGGEAMALSGGGADLHARTALLNLIVETYAHHWGVKRVDIEDPLEIFTAYPGVAAVVVFPQYDPAEILDIARVRARVPAGITRHIIHGRALRLNYPLDLLALDESLEEKNAGLSRWLQAQFNENRVRFYQEATFLFNE